MSKAIIDCEGSCNVPHRQKVVQSLGKNMFTHMSLVRRILGVKGTQEQILEVRLGQSPRGLNHMSQRGQYLLGGSGS